MTNITRKVGLTKMNGLGLGRIEVIDERDKNFPVSAVLAEGELPPIPSRYWWADGWWGNQGSLSHCVAFAWMHYLEDGPVIQDALEEGRTKPFYSTSEFYDLCQLHDQYPGENYNGTSVRAGAKILKHLNIIKAYHWASTIEDVVKAIKYIGPMVVGTRWYSNMSAPKSTGLISASGDSQGGHAYIVNGLDEKLGILRIKNSWGRGWGKNGYAYIQYDDFSRLLQDGGEACIAFENKMTEVPKLLLG